MNLGRRHTRGQASQGQSKDGCAASLCPGSDQRAAAESAGFCRGRSRSTSREHQRDTFIHNSKRNRRVLKTADSDSECCLVHVQVAEEPKTAFAVDSNLVFAQTPAASERRHRHHRCLFLLLLVARRRESRHTLSPCSATAFQKKSPNKPNFRDC